MNSLVQMSKDYQRIEQAIRFIDENFQRQPDLKEMAAAAGMSEHHFQRVFKRWAGLSPKKFLQFLTKEYAKQLLKDSNLLEASLDAGLSGPGRLHDLFVTFEAMSPGEFKQKGQGLVISYGFHPTPFGECLIAVTKRGVCALLFLGDRSPDEVLRSLKKDWKNAVLKEDRNITKPYIEKIFSKGKKEPVAVLCRGTSFQMKVWEALLKIPPGRVVTYKMLACRINAPKAVRAVGNAVGKNTVAFMIPCHRVIRDSGHLGGYRWGTARKKAMLAVESALSDLP
jgi:AraC family transcriptional regulator of adaptative response/methylated-DNA-[protein]-cysteine methyltransferase